MTSGLPLDAPLLPCLSFSLFDRAGQRIPLLESLAFAKTVGREGLVTLVFRSTQFVRNKWTLWT